MSRTYLAWLLVLLAGCPSGGGSEGDGSSEGGGSGDDATPTGSGPGGADGEARPQETAWRTVVDGLAFPADITTLTVGREQFDGNFGNRGGVEVYFDEDAPVIRVEMRVFEFLDDASFVEAAERFHLWAYTTAGNPRPAKEMPKDDDCTVGAWKDGCTITVHYDGQVMPVRGGVDLRVHLPRSYRGTLEVFAADNLGEHSYPRLGNVIVDGLCGGGRVSLAQGTAAVKLCDGLTPAPTCPADQIAMCEEFTDVMGADAAWSPLCPCPPELFGQLRVESRASWAADITVDAPDTTWLNVHVANEETDRPHPCMSEIAGCDAPSCVLAGDTYAASAEYNYPGPAAPAGAGYNLGVVSTGCGPVDFFASPDDWVDESSAPMTAVHGHVRVCSGCL